MKAYTRTKRVKAPGDKLSHPVPSRKMAAFLRLDENKKELFSFLAKMIVDTSIEKQIITAYHKDVLCTQPRAVAGLAPCSQEEADTRMLLHVAHGVRQDYKKVLIRTVDTDVVILAVTAVGPLGINELWVAFAFELQVLASSYVGCSTGTKTSVEGCHSSISLLGVILYHTSVAGDRKRHGNLESL